MTTAIATPKEERYIVENASWADYTALLDKLDREGRRAVRVNFDCGRMEFMPVSGKHEVVKKTIARLLELYTLERRISSTGFGQVTCRRQDLQKGLEPDECYYITTPAPPAEPGEFRLDIYPPPDLAIEVDVTRSSIPRQPIYAAIGVREIWRFTGSQVQPMRLTTEGRYEPRTRSEILPDLDFDVFNRFLTQALQDQFGATVAFQDWLRAGKA